MGGGAQVNVFEYVDYREYLRAFYGAEKERGARFSHRAFSRRAGLRSSNYLHLVMNGKRELSSEMAPNFARACSLGRAESDYFCELVSFGRAATIDEKNRCYARMVRFRGFRAAHQLDAAQAAYHSSWYVPVIRELVARRDFDEDPKWIAAQLLPPISREQAAEGLALLVELGLLVRGREGRLEQAATIVTTGSGPLGHHVVNYHRTMLERAIRALDELSREERDISTLTLCVAASAVEGLKERVRAFRRELLALAEDDPNPERVVQINFQIFPLTQGASK
jgi:uncharacterized protein (TIGR02147 family)